MAEDTQREENKIQKTSIEWAKNPDGTQGYTWNPITGCLNGCEYCYARKLANTRLKDVYLANLNVSGTGERPRLTDPFYPRFWEEKLYHAWSGKPKGIFVCDMSDLFGIGIPEEWTEKVLNLCRLHDENRYYLLTKQPQNLIKFSPFPDNCWVGVSVTNGKMLDDAGYYLEQVDAKIRFISFEPLLENIKPYFGKPGISWVIIGAQTKPYKPPKVEWVKEIVEAADVAGVPVFLKDNLKPLLKQSGLNINAFWADKRDAAGFEPLHLELRQEMPCGN